MKFTAFLAVIAIVQISGYAHSENQSSESTVSLKSTPESMKDQLNSLVESNIEIKGLYNAVIKYRKMKCDKMQVSITEDDLSVRKFQTTQKCITSRKEEFLVTCNGSIITMMGNSKLRVLSESFSIKAGH